jgi:hypothetical protein
VFSADAAQARDVTASVPIESTLAIEREQSPRRGASRSAAISRAKGNRASRIAETKTSPRQKQCAIGDDR